jgi:hypothetical protein
MKFLMPVFLFVFFLAACCRKDDEVILNPCEGDTSPDTVKVDAGVTLFRSQYDSYCGCKGWGYNLYSNGIQYQYQPHIPAVQGLNSFRSREDALKCARLSQQYGAVQVKQLEDAGLLDCK